MTGQCKAHGQQPSAESASGRSPTRSCTEPSGHQESRLFAVGKNMPLGYVLLSLRCCNQVLLVFNFVLIVQSYFHLLFWHVILACVKQTKQWKLT